MSDFWDYSSIVNKLKEIKDKYQEENNKNKGDNKYNCGWCKQTKTGQYWYNEVAGEKGKLKPISRVKGFYSKFCSQECLNSWNQSNLGEQNNNSSEIMCHECNKFFQGQYWYKNNPRESLIHKFCSESCCDTYWNKKKCSGSDCSNLLTSEEICYCSTCSKKQEDIWKNLDKNSQDINKDLDDFQKGVDNQKNNSNKNKDNNIEREREREREQNSAEQSKLRTEITQLEQKPTNPENKAELERKKNKLKELQEQEKTLRKSLPLETQISILEQQISELEKKTNKTKEEERVLVEKKRELERLLKEKAEKNKQTNTSAPEEESKIGLYIGLGIISGLLILFLVLVLVRNWKNKK